VERARIAFLLACSTAEIIAGKFTDEAIYLAGAFQVAGFGYVIASMWSVKDAICAPVAYYSTIISPSKPPGHLAIDRSPRLCTALCQRSARLKVPVCGHRLFTMAPERMENTGAGAEKIQICICPTSPTDPCLTCPVRSSFRAYSFRFQAFCLIGLSKSSWHVRGIKINLSQRSTCS
jgi:hypothetical protein